MCGTIFSTIHCAITHGRYLDYCDDEFGEFMNQRERMEAGLLYLCNDESIKTEQLKCMERLYDFNATRPSEMEKRNALLKEMFAEIGENCYIEPPLHCNWAGKNVHFGKEVYANFNLTLVDDASIYVGDGTMFAPSVVVSTAGHPINVELREKGYQFVADVHIGKNVWIGSGALIMPGITIGDNSVIGAGSVVTRDVPPNVVAFGNPCRVVREICETDSETYFRGRPIDWEELK